MGGPAQSRISPSILKYTKILLNSRVSTLFKDKSIHGCLRKSFLGTDVLPRELFLGSKVLPRETVLGAKALLRESVFSSKVLPKETVLGSKAPLLCDVCRYRHPPTGLCPSQHSFLHRMD